MYVCVVSVNTLLHLLTIVTLYSITIVCGLSNSRQAAHQRGEQVFTLYCN